MTVLDESTLRTEIRGLAEALVPELQPDMRLADDSEEPMLQLVGAVRSHRARNPRMLLVASVSVAAMILVAVAVTHFTTTNTPRAAGAVGRYFEPSSLPAGWTLLDFTESVGDSRDRQPETMYERTDPPAKLSLAIAPDPQTRVGETPFAAPLSGHWSLQLTPSHDELMFDAVAGPTVVTGQSFGLKVGELEQLLVGLHITARGEPLLNQPEGFVLTAQADTTEQTVAQYKATYGRPGTSPNMAGFLFLTASRLEQPHDARLIAGVDADHVDLNGRRIFEGVITQTSWYPEPDLRVELSASGSIGTTDQLTLRDIAANLQEVELAQLDRQIADIAAATEALPLQATVQFDAATATLYGSRLDPSSLCLTVLSGRRCSMAIGSFATYKSGIAQLKASFLIDNEWFIVGFDSIDRSSAISSDLGIPTIQTAEDDHHRTWTLAQMPTQATKATWGSLDSLGAISRPTR